MKQFSKKNSSLLDNEANTSNVDSLAETSVNRHNLRSSSMPADETDYYAHESKGKRKRSRSRRRGRSLSRGAWFE